VPAPAALEKAKQPGSVHTSLIEKLHHETKQLFPIADQYALDDVGLLRVGHKYLEHMECLVLDAPRFRSQQVHYAHEPLR
jgi:hypothetical protein